jgi:hypothetical protein
MPCRAVIRPVKGEEPRLPKGFRTEFDKASACEEGRQDHGVIVVGN